MLVSPYTFGRIGPTGSGGLTRWHYFGRIALPGLMIRMQSASVASIGYATVRGDVGAYGTGSPSANLLSLGAGYPTLRRIRVCRGTRSRVPPVAPSVCGGQTAAAHTAAVGAARIAAARTAGTRGARAAAGAADEYGAGHNSN